MEIYEKFCVLGFIVVVKGVELVLDLLSETCIENYNPP